MILMRRLAVAHAHVMPMPMPMPMPESVYPIRVRDAVNLASPSLLSNPPSLRGHRTSRHSKILSFFDQFSSLPSI